MDAFLSLFFPYCCPRARTEHNLLRQTPFFCVEERAVRHAIDRLVRLPPFPRIAQHFTHSLLLCRSIFRPAEIPDFLLLATDGVANHLQAPPPAFIRKVKRGDVRVAFFILLVPVATS
jgi:hypothetical protein